MTRLTARLRLLPYAAIVALAGCASLLPEGPRDYTTTLPLQGPATPLDQVAQASMAGVAAGESGFRLLLGPESLDARLALLRGARRSLDLQYYHLHDDATGRLLLRELRDAAQRGVRVRLLLDDLYTDGLELLLNGLGAYPNIELRLFNPFPTRGPLFHRFAAALLDFSRLNRRMHNKLFVADGVLAVTGGRNVGDAYFLRSTEANFFDFDVLASGPAVTQMASVFDEYWNAPQVRGAAALLQPQGAPDSLRRAFDARVDSADTPEPLPYRGVDRLGRAPVVDEFAAGQVALVRGVAQVFADSPAKALGVLEAGRLPSGALLDSSRLTLATEFGRARREIWISSPYLVPGDATLANMRNATARGVRVRLITNSLATTDEPVVHTGYRRYRDNMLRAGVEIFELHPVHGQRLLLRPVPGQDTPLRLHTKAGVIDGTKVFIGSVNIDPRSEGLNTEFGVLIDSPALAAQTQLLLQLVQAEAAYEVRLKPGTQRDLEWLRLDEQQRVEVIDSEPGADLWMRIKLYILSLLIPESLL